MQQLPIEAVANHAVKTMPEKISDREPPQVNTSGKAWLWLDVTTSWRARSGQMNGTLRVEQSYAKALSELLARQLRFCRYHRLRRSFLPLDTYPDLSGLPKAASRGGARQSSPLRAMGRSIERGIRSCRRAVIDRVLRGLGKGGAASAFAGSGGGEVLLLAGENWSPYDFDVIARLRKERGIRIAAICQDLIPIVCPQYFESEEFVAKCYAYADFLVRDVDLVIAISESTKSDILKHAGNRGGVSGRIAVVQLGADLVAAKPARQPRELSEPHQQRYVLSVSTIQLRKNFDLLYRLWRRLAEEKVSDLPTLVIVGQRGHGSDDLLSRIAHDPVTAGKIIVMHHASDEELSWLYQNCLWTLYPSFYEGWGLPISESLAYGKYCLASNSSSLPEAGAGLAKHLDPLDLEAWRNAVLELINSPGRLALLESSIRAEYRPMTWEHSAEILAAELAKLSAAPAAVPDVESIHG